MLPPFMLLACLPLPPMQDPEPIGFLLKTQETITGSLLRLDRDTVVLRVEFLGGGATVRRSLADFAPGSAFEILLLASPPSTFAEHLQMAKQAVQLGILPQAGRQAAFARTLAKEDASGQQGKVLDAWVATTLRTLFDAAIARNALADARHWFRLVMSRVPDNVDDAEVARMLDALVAATATHRSPGAKAPAGPTPAELAAAKLFAPVWKHVKQGDLAVAEGLRNARHTVQATHGYEQGIARYKTAATELQHILAAHAEDPVVQTEAAHLVQRVKDSAIQAALHAGHALVMQGDYRSAYEWANKAMLLEPDNSEAQALRNTIELARAAGGAWGLWGRGGQ